MQSIKPSGNTGGFSFFVLGFFESKCYTGISHINSLPKRILHIAKRGMLLVTERTVTILRVRFTDTGEG